MLGHHHHHQKGAAAQRRRDQLRAKGRLNWDRSSPERGPKQLAIKNHFIAMIGEYVGTVLFMIFALGGTNVALIPNTSITGQTAAGEQDSTVSTVNTSNLLYIALSFGFSLAVNAWIFFRVSGGLFNPAVSLGMALVGALTPTRAVLLAFVQILGGMTGAAIIDAITPGALNVRTQLGGGTSVVQGLFIEMFLTALLMLAILLLAAEKNKATFIAPIGIGLALFVAELLGVYYTGGSLNPARSFGPCVVLRQFENYHWIYWIGPALGAIIAAGFYKLLKWLQYETVLGPEDGEAPKPADKKGKKDVAALGTAGGDGEPGRMVDEEKAIDNSGTMAVSGPGLGDLHTEAAQDGGIFDANHGGHDSEDQLNRIESMLQRILPMLSQETLHGVDSHGDLPRHNNYKDYREKEYRQDREREYRQDRDREHRQSGEREHRQDRDRSQATPAAAPIDPPSQRRTVANPLVAHTIPLDDPRYSAATIIDAKGNSKPVYKK